MTHSTEREAHFRLSAGVQIVVLTGLVLLTGALLLQVFAASLNISRRAKALNDGVQLCRNTAQAFAGADGDLAQTAVLLGGDAPQTVLYFNDSLVCTPQEQADYALTLSTTQEQMPAGTLVSGCFTVTDLSGNEIYTLTTQVYQP